MLVGQRAARLSVGLFAAMTAAAPASVGAQAVPGSDVGAQQVTPGAAQLDLPTPDAADRAPARVRVRSEAVPAAPCPLADYDVQVQIRSIRFAGPSQLTQGGGQPVETPLPPQIAPLLADIAAAPPPGSQPLKVVCEIRDRATARLRQAGYVATVQIPPQRIEEGELRLEVITARIVEVRVRGDAGPYQKTLAARIDQLKALTPLNERDAERVLLLAGDIPGLDVQLALRPANTQPGEVIGELTVAYRRFALLANVQNYASRQLGRETGYVRGEIYGLTGASDVTYIGASSTADFEEQIVAQAGHVMGLGVNGTTLATSFTYAWSKPSLGMLNIRSRSLIAGLELRQPLIRAVDTNLNIAGGFALIEQRTRSDGDPLNRDKLRIAFARLDFATGQRRPDGLNRWFLRGQFELRQGLDWFDASKRGEIAGGFRPTRAQGRPNATVLRGELDGIVGLGPIFSLYGGARGQFASAPLLNFEEYSIGNLTFGRGYDPGANSADRVVALRAEPRARVYAGPRATAELFAFYDRLWIYNLDPGAVEDHRRLDSYGGGARITLPGLALVELTYARPRDKALSTNEKKATDRLLLSVTAQFAPGVK